MTVEEIYDKFAVPPNLVAHMLTVTKVAISIRNHWPGEEIDWDFVFKSTLLHDIGNIVKFKFNLNPEFIGNEQQNIGYWKGVQKRIIDTYGEDDHVATGAMLKEVGVTGHLWDTIQNKSFANVTSAAQGDDWYAKILFYADMRVMPHGIASLEERLSDVRARMPKYATRPDFEELLTSARDIESQIASQLDKPILEIAWGNVRESDSELLNIEV